MAIRVGGVPASAGTPPNEPALPTLRLIPSMPPTWDDAPEPTPPPWEEVEQPRRPSAPSYYRRSTPLVEELDALTGYDSEGLFQAFREALEARHDAKREVSRLQAMIVTLRAKYESHGTQASQAEHERSQVLAEISDDIRTEYYRNPEMEEVPAKRKGEEPTKRAIRLTSDEVASRARAHPRYKRLLDQQGRERAEWARAKADADAAWAQYELQAGVVEYLSKQLEDRKAMIYYASKEWRDATK